MITPAQEENRCLVLGGAGLVGLQVCRVLAREMHPELIVVSSLYKEESVAACSDLSAEFADIRFDPAWGNLFVPQELAHAGRGEILSNPAARGAILDHIFGDFQEAYKSNTLAEMVRRHRPTIIVDCVNTATAISYQDVFGGTAKLREMLDEAPNHPDMRRQVEELMMSQGAPQLIRHLRMLFEACRESRVGVYVKVGTTGTGGMGLNIPYTHSEDRPSSKLLAKTEVAFGHTGLLFLMARTPGAPIVKEVKPAAMIGYRAVSYETIRGPGGKDQHLFDPHEVSVEAGSTLCLRDPEEGYEAHGVLETTVVNTGENGVFTRGEFGAITAPGQMEFVTPEEIARTVLREIHGAVTGRDVISALDSAMMEPSYRAGMIRTVAMEDLAALETRKEDHSVALGQLGPPELSKLLFEAHLIKEAFGARRDAVLVDPAREGEPRDPADVSAVLAELCEHHAVRSLATSVGIPILLPDGKTLLRGPRINVPEIHGLSTDVTLDDGDTLNRYAQKGWIDLRPQNIERWQARFRRMIAARERVATRGSAAFTLETYLKEEIEIGEVVAWIFNNEMRGSRQF